MNSSKKKLESDPRAGVVMEKGMFKFIRAPRVSECTVEHTMAVAVCELTTFIQRNAFFGDILLFASAL